jgi:nucleoside-diphosphate-sugar epimerase
VTTIHLLGSEGFIGRALQREAGNLSMQCWSHRHSKPEHHFDLLDPSSWQSLLRQKPTHVILLSWPGLPNYQESFHVTRNLPACVALVDQLVKAGLQRLVVAGTCYEYGLQNGPLSEDQFTNPTNCYAIAKDSLRRTMANLCSANQVMWSWLRIFYPYGDGQNPKSLLPSLHKAIEQGDQTFSMSSGRQLRDFICVEEVAKQLLVLATHPKSYGIYNGGSGQARSLREVVEARICELGGEIKLDLGVYPDRDDEPLAFWADMSRMNTLTQTQLF